MNVVNQRKKNQIGVTKWHSFIIHRSLLQESVDREQDS